MSLCVLQATCTMYVYVSSGDSNVHIERAIPLPWMRVSQYKITD